MKSLALLLFVGALSTSSAFKINDYSLAQVEESTGNMVAEQTAEPCEYLDETKDELDYQVDMFSRTLDPRYWTNVVNLSKALNKNGVKYAPIQVRTYELYDKAFSFPRVRRYQFVQDNLEMLEHFQDNLNTNIDNSVHMANFLRVANTVRKNLNSKYHDGEFDDPGNHDPREEAEAKPTWASAKV